MNPLLAEDQIEIGIGEKVGRFHGQFLHEVAGGLLAFLDGLAGLHHDLQLKEASQVFHLVKVNAGLAMTIKMTALLHRSQNAQRVGEDRA